jgi:hypothetical protein
LNARITKKARNSCAGKTPMLPSPSASVAPNSANTAIE